MQNHGSLEYSGGGGTPGPGSIPLTSLAPQAANTVVANNTGGAASPTAVPYASMPWVLKAGDEMSGLLKINLNGTALPSGTTAFGVPTLQLGAANGVPSQLVQDSFAAGSGVSLRRANGVNGAPTAILATQNLGFMASLGYDGAAYGLGSAVFLNALENWTPTAHGSTFEFYTTALGTTTFAKRMEIRTGLAMAGTADQGAGTVNATALYENGTALSAKYAQLAVANTFTANQTISATTASLTVGGYLSASSGDRIRLVPSDFGVGKPGLFINGAGTQWSFGLYDTVNSAGTFFFGADQIQMNGALVLGFATGSYKGYGTVNATALYTNGNLAIDTNALLRARVFTIGTLPTAVGADGAKAQVSDSLAAPVFAATLTAGGTVHAPVYSDNAAWRYG